MDRHFRVNAARKVLFVVIGQPPILVLPKVRVHLPAEPTSIPGIHVYAHVKRVPRHPGVTIVSHHGHHRALGLHIKQAFRVDRHRCRAVNRARPGIVMHAHRNLRITGAESDRATHAIYMTMSLS